MSDICDKHRIDKWNDAATHQNKMQGCPYCKIERLQAELADVTRERDLYRHQPSQREVEALKGELARYKAGVGVRAGRFDFVDIEDIVRDMPGSLFRVLVMREEK